MAAEQTGAVPESLQAIEQAAEDIIDNVPSGNWDTINTDVAVIDLFARFNPQIPADIGRLDVLERHVILDVTAQNFDAPRQRSIP